MSWKAFFLIILIIALGIFIYLKIQVLGSPNSKFNQSARFVLAANPFLQTVLGLHSVGDSRSKYLKPGGPIIIEWFKPESENDDYVNQSLMDKFAGVVANYTGKTTTAIQGGSLSDGTIALSNLAAYKLSGSTQLPAGSILQVFFTEDYSPRGSNELSTTYQDSGMVLSLNGHRSFLQDYPQDLDNYLLASLLHEFGNQIGMKETSGSQTDPSCIMNLHAGLNGAPLEDSGLSEPQDFCPAEQTEINSLKLKFGQ